MAVFSFLGGPACGDVHSVVMFGITFPLDEQVVVADAAIAEKLRGNMFFREEGEAAIAAAPEDGAEDETPVVVKRRGRPPRV